MSEYFYELAHKGKLICPQCGHRTFVPYVDSKGKTISPRVGRCDREDKCRYHYTPRQYFKESGSVPTPARPIERKVLPASYINPLMVRQSMSSFRETVLYRYLCGVFPYLKSRLDEVFARYLAGGDPYWEGSNIFWQIDREGKVHTGKIMLYGEDGKRVKEPVSHINWYHTAYDLKDFHLLQCLFGEHLIREDSPVVVVESEKTALVLSLVVSGLTAVSCGGCTGISSRYSEALRGCHVTLIPDNGKYEEWNTRASLLSGCASVKVSRIMEETPCGKGDDIADLILRDPTQENINKLVKKLELCATT